MNADSIKVIYEPSVYLVGRQLTDDSELQRFLQEEGVGWQSDAGSCAEELVEIAGRLCYMSYGNPRPGGNKAYIGHILEVGHGSVLENSVWNFIFTGISRSLSHELVRHRAGWGISQLSQRYVDESDVAFVVPWAVQREKKLYAETVSPKVDAPEWIDWYYSCLQSLNAYRKLSERLADAAPGDLKGTERKKWARQAARSVLPNATETKIFVTVNARALRHFIEQRASRHAEVEIRNLAVRVLKLMQRKAPNLFGDYQLVPLDDGTFEAVTPHKKV